MNRPKILLLAMIIAVIAWAPLESLKAQDLAAPKSNTPPSAQTPNSGPAAKLDEATLGKMFDEFAKIAGGWYLEQRCNFFGKEYKAEFDWNVAQINIALSRQARPAFLLQLQQSARHVAESTDLFRRDQGHNRVHIGQKQGNDQVPNRPNATPALGLRRTLSTLLF